MNKQFAMILAAGFGLATIAGAQKGSLSEPQLTPTTASAPAGSGSTNYVTPPVISQTTFAGTTDLVLDIGGTESWDALLDPSNTVLVVPLGTGAAMTGIGWDVSLSTVGGSWLSEARFYFDGSDQDLSGLFLTPGFADATPGTASYSNPVINLGDYAIPDIPILADGNLYIELNESFDDVGDAVDANWLAGSELTIRYSGGGPPVVPTVSEWGLILLTALLLIGGAVLIVRRSMQPSPTAV